MFVLFLKVVRISTHNPIDNIAKAVYNYNGSKAYGLNGWQENEAMERFTSSKLYTYLEREGTKVWQ